MNPKFKKFIKYALIILAALFVVSFIIGLIFSVYHSTESYQSSPNYWIAKLNKTNSFIVTDRVTSEKAYYENDVEQYNDGIRRSSFVVYGWFDGNFFENGYFEKGILKIKVGPDMNPKDGIAEVFMIEQFINGEPYIEIFLDEDWKKTYPVTNIWYGREYENFALFNYTKSYSGIYYNQVKDDINRFIIGSEPLQADGGVLLGNMQRSDWLEKKTQGKTIIWFTS